jgi:pimeloyl-ACP methyl ester carboxylesterase
MAPPPIRPPGRLIDVGTHRLHIHCSGSGTPAVVFDAALGGSSLSWTLVQPAVAEFTTACSYDRAGFGWSDAGPRPRTAARIADELFTLLDAAGVAPPYILAGHSFGGLVARAFAGAHRELVAGLIFIDPAHPEDWIDPPQSERARIAKGARLCRQGAVAARLGIAALVSALVSAGALTAARRLTGVVSRGGLRREDEEILAPVTKLPAEVRPVLKWMWTQPRFFEALGSQIESVCASAAALDLAPDYGDLPLVTISATAPSDRRRTLQEALARRSTRGRHIITRDSGHWIPLDEPQTVVSAVRDVVEMARLMGRPKGLRYD